MGGERLFDGGNRDSALWRLALAEETFVGLCVSASEVLGLNAPGAAA